MAIWKAGTRNTKHKGIISYIVSIKEAKKHSSNGAVIKEAKSLLVRGGVWIEVKQKIITPKDVVPIKEAKMHSSNSVAMKEAKSIFLDVVSIKEAKKKDYLLRRRTRIRRAIQNSSRWKKVILFLHIRRVTSVVGTQVVFDIPVQ